MPAPESCRGVNDTYPDLTPGPERWSITPIDNGLRLVAGVLRANVNHVNCVQCSCLLWQRSMDFKSCMALAFLLLLVFLSFVTEVYGLKCTLTLVHIIPVFYDRSLWTLNPVWHCHPLDCLYCRAWSCMLFLSLWQRSMDFDFLYGSAIPWTASNSNWLWPITPTGGDQSGMNTRRDMYTSGEYM